MDLLLTELSDLQDFSFWYCGQDSPPSKRAHDLYFEFTINPLSPTFKYDKFLLAREERDNNYKYHVLHMDELLSDSEDKDNSLQMAQEEDKNMEFEPTLDPSSLPTSVSASTHVEPH